MEPEQKDQEYNIHLAQDRDQSKNQVEKPLFHDEEDEIDLRDYIEVLWRRKWAVMAIFLVAVVVAGVVSFVMPETYQAKNLVEIGQIKGKMLQSLDDIQSIFNRDNILKELKEKLIEPLDLPETTTTNSIANMFDIKKASEASTSDSHFIEILGRANTPEKAVIVVKTVTEKLLDYHQNIFKEAEKTYEIELTTIENSLVKTEKDLEKTKQDISRLEQDIQVYQQEIEKRDDIQTEGQGRIAESYINLLAEVKNQKENKESQLLNLEQELINLEQDIQQKISERVYQTKSTKIEVPSVNPETRIAPKRKQNVMIAGILGLFMGIFYAFGAEYFKRT
jgi:capsular polysaccharide biosynthesis protein